MIEPDVMMSSEETAALGQLKEIISANVPSGMIEAHAFRLVGEPQETIDAEAHELFQVLLRQSPSGLPLSHSAAFGFAFALREIVRERIREIEDNAS
jgi:hypothetical protein